MSWNFVEFQKILKCLKVKMLVDLAHYIVPTIQYKVLGLYNCGFHSSFCASCQRCHQFSFIVSSFPPRSLSLSLSHIHTKVVKCISAFYWFLNSQHWKSFHVVRRFKRRESWCKECVIWRWSSSLCSCIAKLWVLFSS